MLPGSPAEAGEGEARRIMARGDLLSRWGPGAHGGTYGGNPLACAIALAACSTSSPDGEAADAGLGEQSQDGLAAADPRW